MGINFSFSVTPSGSISGSALVPADFMSALAL